VSCGREPIEHDPCECSTCVVARARDGHIRWAGRTILEAAGEPPRELTNVEFAMATWGLNAGRVLGDRIFEPGELFENEEETT
jgi:hypothetical protein